VPWLYSDWQLPVRNDPSSYQWTTEVSALGNLLINITALEEAHPDVGHGFPFLALTIGVIGHAEYPESMFTITASENVESGGATSETGGYECICINNIYTHMDICDTCTCTYAYTAVFRLTNMIASTARYPITNL
jgi:hypothetical protein